MRLLPSQPRVLWGALALLSALSVGVALPTPAQVTPELSFEAPPVGSPGNREAGSGRSDTCAALTAQAGLTALVPETNVGLTTQATPTLFAYVPSNNAAFAELRLIQESTGEAVYVGDVSMPLATDADYVYQAAVLSLSLPPEVMLEPNENYVWALMLACNADNRAEDIVVTAVVQRAGDTYLNTLSPAVSDQLEGLSSASEAEKLMIYSSAGLWQDLLTQLAVLVDDDPATYEPLWSRLLEEQGLAEIAAAPLYESQVTSMASRVNEL